MEEKIKCLERLVREADRRLEREIEFTVAKLETAKKLEANKYKAGEFECILSSALRRLGDAGRELEVRCRQLEMLRDMQEEAAAASDAATA